MKYSKTFSTTLHDTDANGIISASAALKFMQECAYSQLNDCGPSMDTLRKEYGLAFVISKITVSFYKPIHKFENLTVETWACESKGYSYLRCYRIIRDNTIVAEASSVWALINTESKRPTKVGEVDFNFACDEPLDLDIPRHIKMSDSPRLVGERAVMFSDIDENIHLTNTKYPDIICDYLPDMIKKRISKLTINFMSEAPFGEVLKVYRENDDENYFIRTKRKDGKTNIEAEILLEDIL